MSEVAIESVVNDNVSQYGERLMGRTKQQKAREAEIRDSERDYWVAKLQRLGDGRANRKATKEARAAYRHAAALIDQNLDE